jgi:hypothetical protein
MVNSFGPGRRRGGEIARGPQPRSAAPPAREGPSAEGHKVFARIVDRESRRPISGARYEVVNAQGAVVAQGVTDWQGTVRHAVEQNGRYTIRVVEVPSGSSGAAEGEAGGSGGG